MKVKELITELLEYDLDLEVHVGFTNTDSEEGERPCTAALRSFKIEVPEWSVFHRQVLVLEGY